MYVIGIDPGPVTGIALLIGQRAMGTDRPTLLLGVEVLQVSYGAVIPVLDGLLGIAPGTELAIERFVVGPRAARSSDSGAGEITRELIGVVRHWASLSKKERVPFVERSAAEVKPWATDARLAAGGLLEATKGMRHARDATRHALFCAVRDHDLVDPLSLKAGAR